MLTSGMVPHPGDGDLKSRGYLIRRHKERIGDDFCFGAHTGTCVVLRFSRSRPNSEAADLLLRRLRWRTLPVCFLRVSSADTLDFGSLVVNSVGRVSLRRRLYSIGWRRGPAASGRKQFRAIVRRKLHGLAVLGARNTGTKSTSRSQSGSRCQSTGKHRDSVDGLQTTRGCAVCGTGTHVAV